MNEKFIYHQRGKDPLYKIWHASKEHLILYFHSDGGSIVCTEKVFPIKKGALVLIAADTYHFTMPDAPQRYDRSKVWIPVQTMSGLLSLLSEQNKFRTLHKQALIYAEIPQQDQPEIDRIFCQIAACRAGDDRELFLFSGCMKLLVYLNRYSVESVPTTAGAVSKAIEFITQNISSDMDIDTICAAVNISKYYFCRQFKIHTGMTVMGYILKTRIILAKSELKESDLSIGEIAAKYGFSSISYFCRAFKEDAGCSPLQYRKQNRVSNREHDV